MKREEIHKNQIYYKTGSINARNRMDIYRNCEGFSVHKCWDAENIRNCSCKNIVVVPLKDGTYMIGEKTTLEEVLLK
jgi:hypothetical protein